MINIFRAQLIWLIAFLHIAVFVSSNVNETLQKAIEFYYQANTLASNKQYDTAIPLYCQALDLVWEFPEAHQNVANAYNLLGNFELARNHHRHSISFAPTKEFQLEALFNLINLETKLWPFDKSILVRGVNEAEQILQDYVGTPSIFSTLALYHRRLGNTDQALKYLQMAKTLEPTHVLASLNIGNHFFYKNDYINATDSYESALKFVTADTPLEEVLAIRINLGQTLRQRGMYFPALEHFQQAIALAPTSPILRYATYLTNILAVKSLGNIWENYEESEVKVVSSVNKLRYEFESLRRMQNSEFTLDPYTISLIRYAFPADDRFVAHSACPVSSPLIPYTQTINDLLMGEKTSFRSSPQSKIPWKLNVGYVSYDWRQHPMGRLTASLVTPTPYTQHKNLIDVHCFMYGENDHSQMRYFVGKYCPHFHDLYAATPFDEDAGKLIHQQNIDILVDITGHTYNGRIGIACSRPAKIVINYLGYPGTTGCKSFDFTMIDRLIGSAEYVGNSAVYSESLILLPYSYQANYMPVSLIYNHNHIGETAGSMNISKDIQEANDGKLRVCVFNSNKKFEPISFQTWMNLLHSVPHSELVFLDVPKDVVTELFRQAAYYGIPPDRLQILPRKMWVEHLERAQDVCDVALDNFVYGAHTTASDLLWMGIPILVLRGYGVNFGIRMPSRVAASSLNNLWYPEDKNYNLHPKPENDNKSMVLDVLIQDTIKGYEEVFHRISRKSENVLTRLTSIIEHQRCRCPLFNTPEHTETTSMAYHAAYEIYELLHDDAKMVVQSASKTYLNLLKSKYASLTFENKTDFGDRSILPHLVVVPQNPPKEIDFCVKEATLQNSFLIDNAHASHFVVPPQIQSTNGLTVDQERSFNWHGVIPLSTSSAVDVNLSDLLREMSTNSALWTREKVTMIFAIVNRDQCKASIHNNTETDCRALEDSFVEWLHHLYHDPWHPLAQLVTAFLYDTVHHYYFDQVISAKDQNEFVDVRYVKGRYTFAQNKSIAARLKASVFAEIRLPCESAALAKFYTFPWQSLSQEELQGFVYQLEACFASNLFDNLTNHDIYFGSQAKLFLPTYPREQVPTLHSWSWRMRWELQRFLTVVGTEQIMRQEEPIVHGKPRKKDTLYAMRILLAAFYWTPSLLKETVYSKEEQIVPRDIPYTADEQRDLLTQLKLSPTGQCSNAEELVTLAIRPLLNLALWSQDFPLRRGPWSFFLGYLAVHVSQTMLTHVRDVDAPFSDLSLPTLPTGIFSDAFLKQYFTGMQSLSPSGELNLSKDLTPQQEMDTKTIAIYCHEFGNAWWPGWGPSSFPSEYPFPSYLFQKANLSEKERLEQHQTKWNQGKAAGGSEEAVAYLAVALAKKGYRVHLYVDSLPPENEYGYTVFYGNTPEDVRNAATHPHHSNNNNNGGYVRWLLRRDYDRSFPFSVFIAWRIAWNLALCPATTNGKCYLWAHDLLTSPALPPLELGGFIVDGILTQSTFHRDFIVQMYEQERAARPMYSLYRENKSAGVVQMGILPNGLPDNAFPSFAAVTVTERNPLRFIYASAPYRGLQDLLETLWPEIHRRYPMTQLHVFYGFTPQNVVNLRWMVGGKPDLFTVPADFQLPSSHPESHEIGDKNNSNKNNQQQQDPAIRWILYMLHLLRTTPGVVYHGSVSHSVLTQAMSQSSFLLYPSAFSETGCITMMRAMAAGTLPITSRYTDSVLFTLGGERYDLGPRDVPLTPQIAKVPTMKRQWLLEQFLPAVFRAIEFVTPVAGTNAVEVESPDATQLRKEMQEHSFTHHRWEHSASVLETIIQG